MEYKVSVRRRTICKTTCSKHNIRYGNGDNRLADEWTMIVNNTISHQQDRARWIPQLPPPPTCPPCLSSSTLDLVGNTPTVWCSPKNIFTRKKKEWVLDRPEACCSVDMPKFCALTSHTDGRFPYFCVCNFAHWVGVLLTSCWRYG